MIVQYYLSDISQDSDKIPDDYRLDHTEELYDSAELVGLRYYCVKKTSSELSIEADRKRDAELVEQQSLFSNLALKALSQVLTDEQALSIDLLFDDWSGDSVSYSENDRVRYNDVLYRCLQSHTSQASWTPTDAPSLWAKCLIDPDVPGIPEWEQPSSTNPYSKGDRVTHNGKTWESKIDNNVWEPGVTGTETLWVEVS